MGVLKEMLRIKEFREEKAERELMQARRALEEAQVALEQAREAVLEQKAAAERKERALYADLCSRVIRMGELDEVKLEVELMRQEGERLQEEVKSAEIVVNASREHLDGALAEHRHAMRAREKFSELAAAAELEEASERDRIEDGELEEAAMVRLRLQAVNWIDEAGLEQAA